jgi:hypothetical protein
MSFWEKLQHNRELIRAQLTPGERLFAYSWLALTMVLPFAGAILIGAGSTTRAIGIGLLAAGLVFALVPISPILRARVRRREQDSADRADRRR